VIDVSGLVKRYGDRTVLDGIELSVGEGEIVSLMGSSGGGKTTLLKCVSGLTEPTSGSVVVDGIDVQRDPEGARRKMGMAFQSSALFDYMTVAENVAFGIRRHLHLGRAEESALVDECLDRVGLERAAGKLMPSELSGGMRKRAGIARAIALRPKAMLYDEPTTGLDPITTYTIDALIVQLRDDLKIASLVVSHDVTSVFRISDRIAFLHGGKLAFEGTSEEFGRSRIQEIRELVEKSQATEFLPAN